MKSRGFLLQTDTPYACEWNGFRVICPEMKIYSTEINPFTKTYSVSHTELLHAITHHQPGSELLKTIMFRYLGTQQLREDIAFYRNLYLAMTKTEKEDHMAVSISGVLCAYFVATYTGNNYTRDFDEKTFSANFIRFLESRFK